MFLLCLLSPLLFASSLVYSLPLGDDPMVELIKAVIYEADQFIALEHKDQLKLPDLDVYPWMDIIKLRNGHLGDFSTIQLRGTPNVTFEDNPDGSMTFHIDLFLGLDRLGILYDFSIDILEIFSKVGNCSVWTKHNLAEVNATFRIGGAHKCDAKLNSFELKELGNLQINILPDDLPEIDAVSEFLLNFMAARLIPITNSVVREVLATDFFRQKFSEIVCSKVPFYNNHGHYKEYYATLA